MRSNILPGLPMITCGFVFNNSNELFSDVPPISLTILISKYLLISFVKS